MKASDARTLTVDQIDDEVLKLKKEQFNLRFQRATGQLENTSRIREVRRDIGRMKTIARQKRVARPESAESTKGAAKPKRAARSERAAKPKSKPRSKSKSKPK